MEAGAPSPDRVWRTATSLRVGSVVGLVGWIALALGMTFGGGVGVGVLMIVWLVGLVYALAAWRLAFVPFVALTDAGVVVRNRFGERTVAYSDITSVQPGYYGTTLRRGTGAPVTAWAVQKPNWATWLHRRTRADELADAINARLPAGPFDS